MKRLSTRVLLGLLALTTAAMAWTRAGWPYFVAAAFLSSGVLFLLWRRDALSTRAVLLGAVVFRLLFLPLPPGLSDDGYRYVWDGLVQLEGVNPYRYVPEAAELEPLHDEPVYEEINSASFYSVYPPFAQLVFAAGGGFYAWGWPASFYVIKGLLVLLEMAGIFVLSRMVSARALLLYAWHPLVLVETAGQGHTEAALVFFLVMTVWAARKGRGGWASALLAGAAWTKLYPLVLYPFLWRRFGWQAVWPGALVSLALWAPYLAPYVPAHMFESLDLYVRSFEFNAGAYYGTKGLFYVFTGADWSKTLGPAFRALFLLSLPGLYLLDTRRSWPLAKAFLVTLGLFFVCSTTVHPWYLLAVLPLAALTPRPSWHWQWLALCSLGTYLLYIDGPYWPFVVAGWAGWGALALVRHNPLLQIKKRAERKFKRIRPHFPQKEERLQVLDLGAGEGFVGAAIHRELEAEVVLADVIDLNRTDLPFVCYDGRHLPFEAKRFDATVLYFVLHHAADPETVMHEALRVTRECVIVVESVYRSSWQRRLLRLLDRAANRLRSGGKMKAQEEHLRFRRAEEWRALARQLEAEVVAEEAWGRVHRQLLLVLRPPS